MRKLIECENEGMESLLGEQVTLFCVNYFYTGTLAGVNEDCVKLENPAIVYDTGPWDDEGYADEQALPCPAIYVRIALIESFGTVK